MLASLIKQLSGRQFTLAFKYQKGQSITSMNFLTKFELLIFNNKL